MGNNLFREVKNSRDIELVAALAGEIWQEHYNDLIGFRQVKYMLKKFQSCEAIAKQIAEEDYKYFLMETEKNKACGYFGFVFRREAGEIFLSKIYIQKAERGKGLAQKAIDFLAEIARDNKLRKITLTVNKGNMSSVSAYKKMGFAVVKEVVQDIGNGFVMDDYVMEKVL